MTTRDVGGDAFEALVYENDLVLVTFTASWCEPCQRFAPVFDAASRQHQDVLFAKVDTDAEQELAAAFEVDTVPSLAAFRDGICVYMHKGDLPGHSLDRLVDWLKGLDMEEVQRKVAELTADDGPLPP